MEKQQGEIDKQDVTMEVVKSTIAGALDLVHEKDIAADTKLRHELDQLAARLEAGHLKLKTMIEQMASGPVPPPGIIPDLSPNIAQIASSIRQLQNDNQNLMNKMPILEEFVKQAGPRIQDAEIKQTFSTGAVQEIQGSMTAMRLEMQQVVQQVGHIIGSADQQGAATRASATTAPAMTSAAPTFDPWAGAAF